LKNPLKIWSLALLAALTVLSALPARAENQIQIKGSDTMVNLVQAWAEKYMEKDPASFIAVTGGGSGTGISALISGTCDIAMSSREIKNKEREMAAKKNTDPKEFKVALDGLAVVVHPSNPVSKLTMTQLADIFTGAVKNWKEVGGQDMPFVVLSREVNSGTHVYFKEHILSQGDNQREFTPDALLLSSSQAIADEVSQNSAAIGYYGMGYISEKHKPVAIAKTSGDEYVQPTIEDVRSGRYPISRPLLMYTPGKPKDAVKGFIDFILSPEGQAIVEKEDFVPIAH